MSRASIFVVSAILTILTVASALAQTQSVTGYGAKSTTTRSVMEYGARFTTTNSTTAQSSDLAPYLSALEKKIGDKGPKKFIGQVVTIFTLNQNGTVSNIKMTKSSGMAQIDTTAMEAIKSSSPFGALPSGAGKAIGVQVSFEGTSQASTCHAIRTR